MKRLFFLVAILLIGISACYAQQGTIRLLTFGGYTFEDKVDFSNGYGQVSDGFQWGAGLEIGLTDINFVEVYYQRLDTRGFAVPRFGDALEADIGINYIMIGGTRYAPFSDVVSGFGSLDVGAAVITAKDRPDQSNLTKFAWGVRAGVQVSPVDRASIRFHAQLLSPIQAAGGGFYFGTGGSGIGVATYSSIYQFNLGGSLIVKIN